MGKEAEAANNETGADEGVNPDTLYDDKGEEQGGDDATDDKAKGEADADAGGDDSDDKSSEEEKKDEDDKGEEDDKGGDDDEYVVPEKYDLTTAEDSLLDQTDIDRISADAKEKGLSNEDAQLMADMEAEAIDRYHGKLDKQVEDIQAGWIKTAEADKEIGGDVFKENAEMSKRVIEKFGSEALKDLLDESKYGNHPEVVRIFSKIGKLMSEDKTFFPKAHETGEKSMEETFYPDANK